MGRQQFPMVRRASPRRGAAVHQGGPYAAKSRIHGQCQLGKAVLDLDNGSGRPPGAQQSHWVSRSWHCYSRLAYPSCSSRPAASWHCSRLASPRHSSRFASRHPTLRETPLQPNNRKGRERVSISFMVSLAFAYCISITASCRSRQSSQAKEGNKGPGRCSNALRPQINCTHNRFLSREVQRRWKEEVFCFAFGVVTMFISK